MATLKGKWKFNENIVIPDDLDAQVVCVFDWGDIKLLSDPEEFNYYTGIWFDRGRLLANGRLIYATDWQVDYALWSIIDFGETERIVSNKFYDIFTANAVQFPDEKVTITYNGTTLASLKGGQTVALKTAKCDIEGDIVVSVPESMGAGAVNDLYTGAITINDDAELVEPTLPATAVGIVYNNTIIASLKAGQMATIECEGDNVKMFSDIVVSVPDEMGVDSIRLIEIPTEAEMTALLSSAEVGSIYKYTGTTGTYENGVLYVVEARE